MGAVAPTPAATDSSSSSPEDRFSLASLLGRALGSSTSSAADPAQEDRRTRQPDGDHLSDDHGTPAHAGSNSSVDATASTSALKQHLSPLSGRHYGGRSMARSPQPQPQQPPVPELEFIYTDFNPKVGNGDAKNGIGSGGFFPSRGFGDDISYGAGAAYVAGIAAGSAWGVVQGLQAAPGNVAVPSARLRANAVANAMARRGPLVGTTLGCVAVLYNCINTPASAFVDRRFWPALSVGSAAAAGAIFKSTRGWRAMARTGAACAVAGFAYQASRELLYGSRLN